MKPFDIIEERNIRFDCVRSTTKTLTIFWVYYFKNVTNKTRRKEILNR